MAKDIPLPLPSGFICDPIVYGLREDRQEKAKNFAGYYAEELCLTSQIDSRRLEQAADRAEALASACREEAARMRKLEGDIAVIPNLKRLVRKLRGKDS